MLNKIDAKSELRDRISTNLLEDANDLMAFIQDASRLAALGDDSAVTQLPDIFRRPEFADNLAESLKDRCEQGKYEAWEYEGEQLALSLIEAQDFYCFHRRFAPFLEQTLVTAISGVKLPVRIWFDKWWEVCEVSRLNEDAVQMIKNFRKVFPIPEEECLPVISTPIAEWQYALLDYLYKDVELPVLNARWNNGDIWFQPRGKVDETPVAATQTIPVAACDDGAPSDTLKRLVQSTTGNIAIPLGTFSIERVLDDHWTLHVSVTDVSSEPVPVDNIRISYIPAFRDAAKATHWNINLKQFSLAKREKLLNEQLVVQMADGTKIKCI
jgi:hypothetical protein